jgi:cytochrome oxidase Cu insertion factor (SCO1/SenC/PrrC family)
MRLFSHWPRAGLGALLALLCAGITGAREEAPKVEVGKAAPAFDLPATQISKALPDKKDAKTISLKDFEGKKNVVLFFYPKAMTGG